MSETTTNDVREKLSSNESSTSNEEKGGDGMEKRKRKDYDGSYAHGVTPDTEHIKTITEYNNAMGRLEMRRNHLIGEYKGVESEYADANGDVSARAELLKKKSLKERQIDAVDETRDKLEKIKAETEENERKAQESVEFKKFN